MVSLWQTWLHVFNYSRLVPNPNTKRVLIMSYFMFLLNILVQYETIYWIGFIEFWVNMHWELLLCGNRLQCELCRVGVWKTCHIGWLETLKDTATNHEQNRSRCCFWPNRNDWRRMHLNELTIFHVLTSTEFLFPHPCTSAHCSNCIFIPYISQTNSARMTAISEDLSCCLAPNKEDDWYSSIRDWTNCNGACHYVSTH